jgi:hypothetical protein
MDNQPARLGLPSSQVGPACQERIISFQRRMISLLGQGRFTSLSRRDDRSVRQDVLARQEGVMLTSLPGKDDQPARVRKTSLPGKDDQSAR